MRRFLVTILIVSSLISLMACSRSDNKEQPSSVDMQEQATLVSTPTPTPLIEQVKTEHQQNSNAGNYDFTVYQDDDMQSVQPDAYREHVEKEGWPNNYKSSGNYNQSVFFNNKYQAKVDKTIKSEDEIVKAISVDFAEQLVSRVIFKEMKKTDFGYMCWLNWDVGSELRGSHILIAFISLKEKTIWWNRCK